MELRHYGLAVLRFSGPFEESALSNLRGFPARIRTEIAPLGPESPSFGRRESGASLGTSTRIAAFVAPSLVHWTNEAKWYRRQELHPHVAA